MTPKGLQCKLAHGFPAVTNACKRRIAIASHLMQVCRFVGILYGELLKRKRIEGGGKRAKQEKVEEKVKEEEEEEREKG